MSKVYFKNIGFISSILSKTDFSKLFVLVDENTHKHCYPLITEHIGKHNIIQINSGEKNKTLESCTHIWNSLTEAQADRRSLLINLGGGVITDMGGFCAGTYKRGIKFINIPTTLLAQVDASVGAKTGIDFNGFKNHIGLFCNAEAVLIDSLFHESLDERQLKSGFAEMLKHGLIADFKHWNECLNQGYKTVDNQLIKKSVDIKKSVVEADPQEKGLRKILNFGHTIGHAIESHLLSSENELLHGEAIGNGMIAEAFLSFKKGFISSEDYRLIKGELSKLYDKPKIKKASFDELKGLCLQDKKNDNGKLNMSLLKTLGQATYNIEIDEILLESALNEVL
ncbi:3-dehydroquinate synthase [Marivirga arenosa]|uniref:3-dehydroquinate synthase n=1 Tax=Marivirga arenosa TaxID=3059076 RepID=A0AA51ZXK1_9BACT|nr:3-dehydroquinate synthase [Marivirga sp. BKB1-2]WNB18614.1 3-dehydroquinate synthase [Marivirga sp. BKB1-2]